MCESIEKIIVPFLEHSLNLDDAQYKKLITAFNVSSYQKLLKLKQFRSADSETDDFIMFKSLFYLILIY